MYEVHSPGPQTERPSTYSRPGLCPRQGDGRPTRAPSLVGACLSVLSEVRLIELTLMK